MKSTLSRFINSSVTWRPTSGLNWSSAKTISAGNPPILPPSIDSASSAESFMCLPMTPAGPLSVVTKPILTLSAAPAGAADRSSAAAAAICLLMSPPYPLRLRSAGGQLDILEIAGLAVDARAWRRDPRCEAAGLGDRPHQALDEQIVGGGRQELVAAPLPLLLAQQLAVRIRVDRGELADAAVECDMRQPDAVVEAA